MLCGDVEARRAGEGSWGSIGASAHPHAAAGGLKAEQTEGRQAEGRQSGVGTAER